MSYNLTEGGKGSENNNLPYKGLKTTAIRVGTGERIEFDSMSKCSEVLNISIGIIANICAKKNRPKTSRGWIFENEKYGPAIIPKESENKGIWKRGNWFFIYVDRKLIGKTRTKLEAIEYKNNFLNSLNDF